MPRMNKLSSYKTTITRDEAGATYVTYHRTVIVKFDDRSITLNTGGWDSVTTRRKMNQAARQFGLPFGVYRKAHVTYVQWAGGELQPLDRTASFCIGRGSDGDA